MGKKRYWLKTSRRRQSSFDHYESTIRSHEFWKEIFILWTLQSGSVIYIRRTSPE
jgi:hypothetical protein